MEEFLRAIGDAGFPMVISVYLLVRLDQKLDKLFEALSQLARALDAGGTGGQ